MLNWISVNFGHLWGPLRLLNSFFFLAAVGYAAAALTTWWLLRGSGTDCRETAAGRSP